MDTRGRRVAPAHVLPWPARWGDRPLFSYPHRTPSSRTPPLSSLATAPDIASVQLGRVLAPTLVAAPVPSMSRATQPRPPDLHSRRSDLERIRPDLSSPGCGRPRRGMDWPGTGPERPRQGRVQVLIPPLAARIYTFGGSLTDTRTAIGRARCWPKSSSANRCHSLSAMTAQRRSCVACLQRRNIPDGCSSSAQPMGYVLLSFGCALGFD